MIKEVFPQWVIVDNQIRRVSDFSHIPPPSRPEAICPLCMNPIIMKLGNERVHHYAHQPDVVCVATQPETALHLNTKYYIYKQLLSGTQLYLEQQCSKGCGKSRNVSWVKGWEKVTIEDRVEIESEIGSFRPDIAIISSGRTSNAIEVVVTHHVEGEKEAFYEKQNIRWLEVEACESIYEGENVWRIDKPLPFSVCKPPLFEWTCDTCLEQMRKDTERELRERRIEEWLQHNSLETIYAKMVDFYYPSGKKWRETYYLNKVIRNDKPVGIEVKTPKNVVFQKNGEIAEALLELAFSATKGEIDRRCKAGTIVDDRGWTPWVRGRKFVARDIEHYPFRYEWDAKAEKWVKLEWDDGIRKWVNREQQKEGVCIRCGQITTKWRWFNGRECECWECGQKREYKPSIDII